VTDLRVSREHAEVLAEVNPDRRVSRLHAETLAEVNPDRRVSRLHVEVLYPTVNDIDASGDIGAVTGDVSLDVTWPNSDVVVDGAVGSVTGDVALEVPGVDLTVDGAIGSITGDVTIDKPEFVADGVVSPITGDVSIETVASGWASAVTATGPLAWWRMGDAGSVLIDGSGNGHHGTYAGARSTADPIAGGDGLSTLWGSAGGEARVTDDGWADVADIGVMLWVDLDGAYVGTAQQWLLRKGDNFLVQITAGGDLRFTVPVVGGHTDSSANIAFSGGRHSIAATHDGTRVKLYVDGTLVSDTIATADWLNDGLDWIIGRNNSDFYPRGREDEVIVWDYAPTASTITSLHAAGAVSSMTADGSVAAVTGDVALDVAPMVIVDGDVGAVTGDVALDLVPISFVDVDGLVPAVTGNAALDLVPISFVTVDGAIPAVTGTADLRPPFTVDVDGAVPAVTGDVDLHGSDDLTVDGLIGDITGEVSLGIPTQPFISNRQGGRIREGLAVVTYEPPIVDPPIRDAVKHTPMSAAAYGAVTMNGTQAVSTVTKATAQRQRTRIIIGGRDVSFFRGVPTPEPTYSLVAPLLYGSASIILPQVAVPFETPGRGELAWLQPEARVLIQRVDLDTNEVVATDYKGVVVKFGVRPDPSSGGLEVQVGGEATGRAAMIDKQPPLFYKRNDLGFWWWGGIQELGLKFEPRLGDETGIVLRNAGGMSHLDYLLDLSAKGARRNGAQLTCMPDAHEDGGAYRVVTKDLDTIHATVYLDDSVSIPALDRDLAEEPNRIYATGVTPEGMRVKFGAYPVLRDDTPPPYPFNDDRSFGIGTVDADTDSGDGVSVMIWRLVKTGYLALADKPGGYDSDVSDAVRDLKEDAIGGDGTATFFDGNMTPTAWAALFDTSATGYSLAGTQILPAAERRSVRKWTRSSNGSVIGRDPYYDPTRLKVDSTVDMGVGMTRKQMRTWARTELSPGTSPNWVGTITLRSGAVIAGEHTPGSALTAADLMPAKALRPGMNVWLPQFDDGILVHVSGVEVRGTTPDEVVLTVDTRARDTMKVWEIIRRNRDSRRNPARAWLNQHRSSSLTKDAVGEFDEIGGVIDDRVTLAAGSWTVFPVVAGQEGVIRSLRIETVTPTEFVVAVFGKQIKPTALSSMVGNPLTKRGMKKWVDEDVRAKLDEDYVLLYAAGEKQAPCGYFPGSKFPDGAPDDSASSDDDTDTPDAAFLTGRWEDDAGFSYHTFDGPVLWVAVYAVDASHVRAGRIMWPQLEAGS
jgi:hypothetical protein